MGAMTETRCQVIDFAAAKANRPKIISRAKKLKQQNSSIPQAWPLRMSRNVQLVPKHGRKRHCILKNKCRKECRGHPDTKNELYGEYNEKTKERLGKEISYWLRALDGLRNMFNDEGKVLRLSEKELKNKLEYARQLQRVLQGIALPQPDILIRKNSLCGTYQGLETEVGNPMQHFTNAQMREAAVGIDLHINLDGAYFAFWGNLVSGMRQDFAKLLCEINNLSYPEDPSALQLLMHNGGYYAPVCISRMIGEPAIPHKVRMGYINALKKLASVSPSQSENEPQNELLIRALSRFHLFDTTSQLEEGTAIEEPKTLAKVNASNLQATAELSMDQLFKAIMDISGRLDNMALSASKKRIVAEHRESIDSLYAGLKDLLKFAVGKNLPNKEMFQNTCLKMQKAIEGKEMDSGEQFFVKHVLRRLSKGNVELASVDAILGVLRAPEKYKVNYLKKLQIKE